jgi:hypothetical protein
LALDHCVEDIARFPQIDIGITRTCPLGIHG